MMKNLIKTEEEIMKGEEEHSSDDLERKYGEHITNHKEIRVRHAGELDWTTHVQRHAFIAKTCTVQRHRPLRVEVVVFLPLAFHARAYEYLQLLRHFKPMKSPT